MLDFIGMVVTAALMMLVVNALTTFMDVSRAAKVTLAAMIGVWIGLAAAAAGAGWLTTSQPVPVVGLFVVVPPLAAALAAAWPPAREAMLSIPMPVMVALNIVRVFAVLFLMLAAEGRLTGPFPYSAAWGDIITGIVAVPVLWLLKDGGRATTRQLRPGTCSAPPISCWRLASASLRRRARPCSCSPAQARKRCSTRRGPLFRRCWSQSG
jgi:membrane associated rhomboid family serine protease